MLPSIFAQDRRLSGSGMGPVYRFFSVGCIEEIAWEQGYINDTQLEAIGMTMEKNRYGQYLLGRLQD